MRSLAGVIAVAVLAAAGLSGATGASGEAADCAWHHHTKRVVKHIRRHGKLKRVVRIRRWWTCDPLPPPPPPVGPARLSVKAIEHGATDFSYLLSRPNVASGDIIIELDNLGSDAHNLNIQQVDSTDPPLHMDDTNPLTNRSASFTLQPGTYRLWCSLPQHEAYGMHATLIVDSP